MEKEKRKAVPVKMWKEMKESMRKVMPVKEQKLLKEAERYKNALRKMPDAPEDLNEEARFYLGHEEEYRKPMLQLAEACAKLGISYENFLNMLMSFEDPYSDISLKITVREKNPIKVEKAFKELKNALQLGISIHNKGIAEPVKLDRLTLRGNKIDFGYGFLSIERRQRVLR